MGLLVMGMRHVDFVIPSGWHLQRHYMGSEALRQLVCTSAHVG